MYLIDTTRQARKDYYGAVCYEWYAAKMAEILAVLRRDPFEPTPGHRFKKLKGKLKNAYSRDINYHNRVVYATFPNAEGARDADGNLYDGIVRLLRARGHDYDSIAMT